MSKEVNDNMAMEELQQVQELEKQLAEQYAAAQAVAKRRIAVEQRAGALSARRSGSQKRL